MSRRSKYDNCLWEGGRNLVSAMDDNDLRLFSDLYSEDLVDPNKEFAEYNHSTLLHLALTGGKEEFAFKILSRADVNPNYPHKIVRSFPLHVAADQGNPRLVRALLEAGADVNARLENGNTALHLAALKSSAKNAKSSDRSKVRAGFLECVEALLEKENVNIDCENNLGISPLFYAAEKGSEKVIRALLKEGAYVKVSVDDESIEDLLSTRFPKGTFQFTPENTRSKDTVENKLFSALYKETTNPGIFISTCNKYKNVTINWNADNGAYSFLQYCCDLGFEKLVDFLLDKGADPNYFCPTYKLAPILLAAHHGFYRIIKEFKELNNDVDFSVVDPFKKENILHKIIKRESKAYINYDQRNYDRCLSLILDDHPSFRVLIQPIVNGSDHLGNTPLHVASQLGQEDTVRKLLRCSANIGIKNLREETPILHISPEVMEEYLDDCLQGEGLTTDEKFKIIFRYSFLGPPLMDAKPEKTQYFRPEPREGDNSLPRYNLPEAEPLWYMSQLPGHRALLTHPVIASFLCMKWRRMRHYFYINLVFYLSFVGFLTTYLLLKNSDENYTEGTLHSFQVVLLILLIILTVRESLQAIVSFRRYIFSFENLLEMTLIALSYYICLSKDLKTEPDRAVSVSALLLSWAEMVLLFGRHPKASTFVTMFKRISQNFILFLTWSISFIIAFALAFYLMLKRPPPSELEKEPVNPYFNSVERSLLKTIIMSLTGEIEFESIEFGQNFGRIVFLLYVFFIMLVLVNLLNGLAVSDISLIQKEAEIVSHVSRIELISYFESMLLGDPFQFFSNWPPFSWGRKVPDCSCLRGIYSSRLISRAIGFMLGSKRFLLFTERLAEKQAIFFPNRSRRERSYHGVHSSSKGLLNPEEIVLDVEILEAAKSRLMRKAESSLFTTNQRISKIESVLKLMSKKQNYIIELLDKMSSKSSKYAETPIHELN